MTESSHHSTARDSDDPGARRLLAPRLHDALGEGTREGEFSRAAEALVADAVAARATDVHLDPNPNAMTVRFRIDGVLHHAGTLDASHGRQILRHLQVRAGIDAVTKTEVHDGHAVIKTEEQDVNVRIASIPAVDGDKLSIRILDASRAPQRLADLGLRADDEEHLRRWIGQTEGMVLVAGPTSSGKTSTLYALLRELAGTPRNLITLEDPVETNLVGVTQVEVHADSVTFASGLVRVLRHDPDVIALGEIRESETARLAVDAALSGHVLLSTLHARDAAGAISLLRNFGVKDYQIAASLRVLVAQRTFRVLCEECKTSRPARPAEQAWLREHGFEVPDRAFESRGCEQCGGTGSSGLVAAFELWQIDQKGHDLILAHRDEQAIREHCRAAGVPSIEADALSKAQEGILALSEIACRP